MRSVPPIPAARGARRAARRQRARAGQESLRSAAARLRAAVAAEEARIADTREGLADAERRLAVLDARARKRRQQLDDTQDKLVATRVRLTRLERKQATAEKLLAENLRRSYMDGEPTFMTVVLNADGFTDLVERFEFLRRDRAPQRLRARRHARRADQGQGDDERPQGAARDLQRARARRRRPTATAPTRSAPPCSTASRTSCAGATARRPSSRRVRGRIAAIERRQAAAARRAAMAASAATAPGAAATRGPAAAAAATSSRASSRPRTRSPHAVRLGRRPRRCLRRLRLLGLDLLRARRGRAAQRLAGLDRLHELGRGRPGPPDHGLRQRGPRVHGRRRPPLRHERAVGRRHALDELDAQHRGLRSPATRPGLRSTGGG